MRLVCIIIISAIFFTSCKSSFTKRHYRPGIFKEHIVVNSDLHKKNSKSSIHHTTSGASEKVENNLNNASIDSLSNYSSNVKNILVKEPNRKIKRKSNFKPNVFKNSETRNSTKDIVFSDSEDDNYNDLTKTWKLFLILFFAILALIVVFAFSLINNPGFYIRIAFIASALTGAIITFILVILSIIKLVMYLKKKKEARKLEPKKDINPNGKFDYFMKWLKISNLIYIPLIIVGVLLAPNWQYLLEIISLSCLFVGAICFVISIILALFAFKWYKKSRFNLDEKNKKKFRLQFWLAMGPLFSLCLVLLLLLIFAF